MTPALTDAQAPDSALCFGWIGCQNRHAILCRIHNVKRAETRARTIAQFVDMLASGGKPHP